jgi:hypothetical protein
VSTTTRAGWRAPGARPLRTPGTAGTGCSHPGRERKQCLSGA